jgi:hypothetical protein
LISRFGLTGGIGLSNFKAFGATVPPVANPPVNTVAPVVTPSTGVFTNTLLTCSTGSWTNTPLSYSYDWFADGGLVQSGSGNTYTPTGQAGKIINCQVNATNADGTGSFASNNTTAVVGVPVNTVAPAVTGTETQGQTLSCTTGTWSNTPSGYTYAWYRGVSAIGSTANTYVVQAADVGQTLSCKVVASNSAGNSVAADSNSTGVIVGLSISTPTLLTNGGVSVVTLNFPAVAAAANAEIWVYLCHRHTVDPSVDTISSSPALTWQGPYASIQNTTGSQKMRSYWYRARVGVSALPSLVITCVQGIGGRHGGAVIQIATNSTLSAPTNVGGATQDTGGDASASLPSPPVAGSMVLMGAAAVGTSITGVLSANYTTLFTGDVSGAALPCAVGYDADPADQAGSFTSSSPNSVGICSMVEVKLA